MAKRKLINERKYTLFIDYDRTGLKLHEEDWIEWFKQRVFFVLIDPLEEMINGDSKINLDNENLSVSLAIATLICCGIEALGGFYKGKSSSDNFKEFVKEYMNQGYKVDKHRLEAIHNYFRCGLAHGFCIKKGGLTWGSKYFVNDETLGLLISIDELFKDFKQAFILYIEQLKMNKGHLVQTFKERFRNAFILGK